MGSKSILSATLHSKDVRYPSLLKFGFSEKATKFEKIFVVLLTRASCSVRATAYLSKSRRRFFKTNVDKSYYTNFTKILRNLCLHFARQDGQDGKNGKKIMQLK